MSDSAANGKPEPQGVPATRDVTPSFGAPRVPADSAAAGGTVRTPLGKMTLSMFARGQFVYVRVGAPHNAIELYEHAFDSADEANTALLDAGILTREQVPDPLQVAGTGIELNEITAEQLEAAGLKKHGGPNL